MSGITLGGFGDRRLEKGALFYMPVLLKLVVVVFASGVLAGRARAKYV
jgi:hypothetical protein